MHACLYFRLIRQILEWPWMVSAGQQPLFLYSLLMTRRLRSRTNEKPKILVTCSHRILHEALSSNTTRILDSSTPHQHQLVMGEGSPCFLAVARYFLKVLCTVIEEIITNRMECMVTTQELTIVLEIYEEDCPRGHIWPLCLSIFRLPCPLIIR